jgi:hypothetical protein
VARFHSPRKRKRPTYGRTSNEQRHEDAQQFY